MTFLSFFTHRVSFFKLAPLHFLHYFIRIPSPLLIESNFPPLTIPSCSLLIFFFFFLNLLSGWVVYIYGAFFSSTHSLHVRICLLRKTWFGESHTFCVECLGACLNGVTTISYGHLLLILLSISNRKYLTPSNHFYFTRSKSLLLSIYQTIQPSSTTSPHPSRPSLPLTIFRLQRSWTVYLFMRRDSVWGKYLQRRFWSNTLITI